MSVAQSVEWFGVSKKGLEGTARRRGLSYVLFELVQNCWDTGAQEVKVTFTPVEGRPLCDVVVEDDDPEGFKDMAHAWTLFAASEKKSNPEKRGRFNLGEKLVLAICESAEIISTKGHVRFDDEGRHAGRKRRDRGTVFMGRLRMTREELAAVLESAKQLIVPEGVVTTINGEVLSQRVALKEFEVTLPTEIADEEGCLRVRHRKTVVDVYECTTPNGGWLFEMGIPVCATGDKWDVDIQQKVPLNMERSGVTDTYLRSLRVYLLNEMFEQLRPEDAAAICVQDALTDERVSSEAVEAVLTHQFGDKRAVYDPSDPEANNRLVSEGYTIIPSRAFSKSAWENIRSSGAAVPSGRLSPTPKPYSSDPDAPQRKLLEESEWTDGIRNIVAYTKELGLKVLGRKVTVTVDRGRFGANWAACYGGGELTFNLAVLGQAWFDQGATPSVNRLLIHEFAHHFEKNHLSDGFYKGQEKVGARMVELALTEPGFFAKHRHQ
jgi:hypothetical protein